MSDVSAARIEVPWCAFHSSPTAYVGRGDMSWHLHFTEHCHTNWRSRIFVEISDGEDTYAAILSDMDRYGWTSDGLIDAWTYL